MTEPSAAVKSGYFLLNTDGGVDGWRRSADPLRPAAIGLVLRTRRLRTVDRLSKAIGPASHHEAEYRALIEGLEVAHAHRVRHLRVYMDSELVVDQMNDRSAVRKSGLRKLHEVARSLAARFESIRISWVPREMNAEADQLVRDALSALN
jgi:ribonuclease H / adenosylcobalamin/alpha-ribazole phosphatase